MILSQERCLLWHHDVEARWSFYKRDVCYGITRRKEGTNGTFTREMCVMKSLRSKEGTMISYKRDVSCESTSIKQRRHNDLLQERCLLWKHEHRAKKAQWSFYKRNTCYEIMRSKEGTMIFVQEICLLWNHEHRAVEGAMSPSIWLCSFLCETQTTVFPDDFTVCLSKAQVCSPKPICTLWSYIDVLNCLRCVMSPVIEARVTPLLLSWAYQCSLPLSEALHIIWSRIYYPFLLWCPEEVLKFLLPCQNLLHC